jgi:hypothetical protein
MWRWAALVIALLAGFALLLTARRAPRRQVANTVPVRSFVVRTNPEREYSRVKIVAQHAEVRTRSAVLTDQLCGMKGPELKRAANETIGQHVMRVTQTSISSWTSSLVASEDPRRQAVGLALENAHPGAPGDRGRDTPVNNNLVLLAIETNDPVIYALALSQCGDLDQVSGPCQALSWEHWANIDPDNAVPWLELAAKASSSGDQHGVDHALAMASTASRFDEYASTVSAIALSALPRDMGPLDKAVAVGDVFSSLSSLGAPPLAITETLCSDTAIQQPVRKQQCTGIANESADKGATLFDVLVASKLARRLGFSADRQSMLENEARSDAAALTAHNPWSLTDEGSGYKLASTNFRCNTVLGYDDLVDALQAANGNWRAALTAVGRTVGSGK